MVFFDPASIHHDSIDGQGRYLYRPEMPQFRFDGWVRLAEPREAVWIAARLDRWANRVGLRVVQGSIYSPVDLDD